MCRAPAAALLSWHICTHQFLGRSKSNSDYSQKAIIATMETPMGIAPTISSGDLSYNTALYGAGYVPFGERTRQSEASISGDALQEFVKRSRQATRIPFRMLLAVYIITQEKRTKRTSLLIMTIYISGTHLTHAFLRVPTANANRHLQPRLPVNESQLKYLSG